jgi:hypothetical protein
LENLPTAAPDEIGAVHASAIEPANGADLMDRDAALAPGIIADQGAPTLMCISLATELPAGLGDNAMPFGMDGKSPRVSKHASQSRQSFELLISIARKPGCPPRPRK